MRSSISSHFDELCLLTSEQRGKVLLALICMAEETETHELDPLCAMFEE